MEVLTGQNGNPKTFVPELRPNSCVVKMSPPKFDLFLEPQTTSIKWMEMVISNHFRNVKIWFIIPLTANHLERVLGWDDWHTFLFSKSRISASIVVSFMQPTCWTKEAYHIEKSTRKTSYNFQVLNGFGDLEEVFGWADLFSSPLDAQPSPLCKSSPLEIPSIFGFKIHHKYVFHCFFGWLFLHQP